MSEEAKEENKIHLTGRRKSDDAPDDSPWDIFIPLFVAFMVLVMSWCCYCVGYNQGANDGFTYAGCMVPSNPQHQCVAPTSYLAR